MKIFVYRFTGVWLPGKAVVTADTETEARAKLIACLEANQLDASTIELKEAFLSSDATTVYFDNGDY